MRNAAAAAEKAESIFHAVELIAFNLVPYLEFLGQVGRPLAPHGGRHLLALLLGGGEDALLVDGAAVAVVVYVLLLADVLVALVAVHGLRVTEDAEAEREDKEGNGLLDEGFTVDSVAQSSNSYFGLASEAIASS